MISIFIMCFILQTSLFNFFFTILQVFAFSYDPCCSFVNNFILLFFKLIIFIVCYLKNSQNFFIQSLLLCTSCLFYMIQNKDIVNIENLMEYVRLLLLQIIFQDYFWIHQSFLLYIQDIQFFMRFTFVFDWKRMKALRQ